MRNPLIYALMFLGMFLIGMQFADAKSAPKYRVAIIDTGFSPLPFNSTGMRLCKSGHFDFSTNTKTVGEDTMYHGSYVAALVNIGADTKKVCYLIYKVFGGRTTIQSVNNALLTAHKNGAKVINLSLSFNMYSETIRNTLVKLTKSGVKIFAAAGNSRANMNEKCNRYPACYAGLNRNFIRVGALDEDMDVAKYSNFGLTVSVYKYGRIFNGSRGTSFAAPRAAGDYIKSLNLK